MEPVMDENKPIRVLLVEDECLISLLVSDALEAQGFLVQAVDNAGEALRLLARSAFDVLFTDINLPGGMDGTTLARCAREIDPGLPVVYASGGVAALAADLRVPGSIFVPKPYRPDAVGRLLARAVRAAETCAA
jgi:CheY-like chemotaxis protein